MYKTTSFFSYFFATALLIISCKSTYQSQTIQFKDYKINKSNQQSSSINALLQPYADSVHKSMNDIIAETDIELEKKLPEGTLGNVLADAMLIKSRQVYKTNVDVSFINNGGMRLPSIAKGKITRSKVYELAPFDNIIVLQKLNGTLLQTFLDHISSRGGWPAAGISWQIKNKKAINVLINNVPINPQTIYTVSLVDYVANGGDDCNMLRNIPQINNGYLFRDAILDYFIDINKAGKKITSKIENRVSYAE